MSRRRKAEKRDILPDPKFNDRVLSRFINIVMNDGKKSTAEKIVYSALDIASSKLKVKNPIDLFKSALNNVKPGIEVRSRRVGGATYQVPVEVRNERAQALAIRWIVDASRKRSALNPRLLCRSRGDPHIARRRWGAWRLEGATRQDG